MSFVAAVRAALPAPMRLNTYRGCVSSVAFRTDAFCVRGAGSLRLEVEGEPNLVAEEAMWDPADHDPGAAARHRGGWAGVAAADALIGGGDGRGEEAEQEGQEGQEGVWGGGRSS